MAKVDMADGTGPASDVGGGALPQDIQIRFRGGGFNPQPRPTAAPIFFLLLIAFWQFASAMQWVNPIFLPSPYQVMSALARLAGSGALVEHLQASFSRVVIGWTVGTICGLLFGLSIGLFSICRAVGLPLVSAFFPIPKIALLPLFILWFGIGEPSKFILIALGVFFPTAIAAYSGIDAVPRSLIRMGQSFNMTTFAIVMKIIIPATLPSILAGFRVTCAIAILLMVAAEMIGAQRGIGYFVLTAGNLMQTNNLLAGVVILSLFGLAVGAGLSALERWLLHWR